jgi:hypothetical protein
MQSIASQQAGSKLFKIEMTDFICYRKFAETIHVHKDESIILISYNIHFLCIPIEQKEIY